ncbi:acyltransferase family protein [Rhodanobacter geophilus]|uniref:Acyltransferase family protein n=1 Tax=Rhodanobacter geophilus TaxID=3162488 RepID=A0ABV3QU16_9GAMM
MQRLPGLDLLRAIAIVWVMLFHSWMIGGIGGPLQTVADYGWMGVDLFFVLSGYLIGCQLLEPLGRGEPLHFGAFYLRRAFRILPVFLVVLAIYLLFPAWREAPGMQPAWQFLTFTVNLLIDYQHNQAFSHAWSLCVEEHFYLLFPLLAWWLARRSSRALVIGFAVLVVATGMLLRGHAVLHGKAWLESVYYPTWTRLDGLLAGAMLATIQAYRPRWWAGMQQRAGALVIAGGLLAAAAIWLFHDKTGFAASVFGFPLLALALALLVAGGAGATRGPARWRIPGAGWLAGVSYSLYLSHKLALHAVHDALLRWPAVHGFAAFALYALAIAATGALLHYAVERPFLRLRTRVVRVGSRGAIETQAASA